MKAKSENQKTAMKLANQYADLYKNLESENSILKKELENANSIALMNKDMLFRIKSEIPEGKEKKLFESLSHEIKCLNSINSSLKQENSDLRKRLSYNHINIEPILTKSQKTIDNLTNKIFLLENTIVKKDNQIKLLTQKNEDLSFNKLVTNDSQYIEVAVSCYYNYTRYVTLIKLLF